MEVIRTGSQGGYRSFEHLEHKIEIRNLGGPWSSWDEYSSTDGGKKTVIRKLEAKCGNTTAEKKGFKDSRR